MIAELSDNVDSLLDKKANLVRKGIIDVEDVKKELRFVAGLSQSSVQAFLYTLLSLELLVSPQSYRQ